MLNLFNLDLHISVIADFEYILKKIFPFDFKINAQSMSGHAPFMNKQISNNYAINRNNWKTLNESLVDLFYTTHKEELKDYDGFVVTFSPSFALLYEQFNKPIIVINATRYEQPASHNGNLEQWEWINKGLQRLRDKNLLITISNNLFDQLYLKKGANIDSVHIPSLCLYTNVDYNVINENRMQYLLYSSLKQEFSNVLNLNNVININHIKPYDYIDLIKAKAIINIPYEISTMSIFEHYSMNIPLIFPSKEFLKQMYKNNLINFYGSYANLFNTKKYPENLQSLLGDNWFNTMVDYADYYDVNNMPYITYFNSFEELPFILNSVDFNNISKKMREFNLKRRVNAFEQWSRILIDTFNLGEYNMKSLDENISNIITTDRYMEKINTYNKPNLIQYYKTDFLFNDGIWRNKLLERYQMNSDILVNGHSDFEINNKMAYVITLKKRPNFIYSINSNSSSKNTLGLPLGITNDCDDSPIHKILGNLEMMREVYLEKSKDTFRKNLVLLNINKTTHPERSYVFDKFSKESYVTVSLPDVSMEGRKKYLIDIASHDFVLCPRGNGIDTHRLWETLYMERIPIVIYTDAHASFIGLPILFINSWDELNENFLREKLIEIKSKKWMWNKVYLDYWINFLS
jgi:hypothetical protein